ncbi:MAG: 6,7-dimethyl-8-ribityllumazine synthase [Nitrospira sp.]|uniref:6,7-dimethyl-8-ribityllumazine synthase n=1 Tax=Nitrospira defluvii TaxID=330214 RepID=A0ABN7L859_9BACT|nr:6,7-dimethyl-8-ribityllumazine synthase [Nitrospira defluvii]MCS6327278.1 6,7-dimethyl-8-ribityllumazine synthase [Nitrospira sp.]CAE6736136.1 6,7-dimethyl-8-ribityllumazine synthase [Nitrospira defluvii]
MKLRKGSQDATGLTFGLVASRFNKFVTSRLLTECVKALSKAGVADDAIEVVRVPGAFEIPLVARQLAKSGRFDAVICLGAVIRGDTPHFEYISSEVSRGILQASMESNIPVIFGVLTTDTVAQAIERADPDKLNRGADAAKTAIEMVNVMRLLKKDMTEDAPPSAAPARPAGRPAARSKR